MNVRTSILGLASGITTLLVVGAVTIELLSGPYGESPGVGILGVFAGLLSGLVATVVVAVYADRLEGWPETLLVAYGTFGATFLGIAALRYVNVPGADELFAFPVHLAASLVLAIVVAGATLATRGRRGEAKETA